MNNFHGSNAGDLSYRQSAFTFVRLLMTGLCGPTIAKSSIAVIIIPLYSAQRHRYNLHMSMVCIQMCDTNGHMKRRGSKEDFPDFTWHMLWAVGGIIFVNPSCRVSQRAKV